MSVSALADRLDSWKEIAAYLGKGVRTVQRWERSEGLPVHRLGQDKTGSVFAYRSELDEWWKERSGNLSAATDDDCPAAPPEPARARYRWAFWTGGALVVVFVAAVLLRPSTPPVAIHRPMPVTTDHGAEIQPAFSPDARQIAYVHFDKTGPGFVYVKSVTGSSVWRLTNGVAGERYPAWSPDGHMIAFLRRLPESSRSALVLVAAGGGKETTIAEVANGPLVWSADGRWLLAVQTPNGKAQLVAIEVATGRQSILTDPMEFGFCGYSLAPDLERVIYCRAGPITAGVYEVPVGADLRPSGPPRPLAEQMPIREMTVASDGRSIVYTEGLDAEQVVLRRMSIEPGAKAQTIETIPERVLMPALSADQHRLAFAGSHSVVMETWRLRLDTATPQVQPVLVSTHSDLNPDYSPDGRYIAFHSTRSGASEIWVAQRDGSNARRLTYTNARTTAAPRWSPDGNWIAFESNQTGQAEVYVIRASGGPAQKLTDDPATDAVPGWSRDGRWIYFCSNRTGRFEVWKMPALGGAPEQVTRDGGFAAVTSPDGRYLYYSQTRNQGPIWRMPLPDGKPEMVIPEIRGLFYSVTSAGVYYANGEAISFWDGATRTSRELYRPSRKLGFGLAVSPDGRDLLFTQFDPQDTDIFVIDGL